MDGWNQNLSKSLQARVAALHAADDENGDGSVNAMDMKLQLDRIEAQLELQGQQNRALLRGQRLRLCLTILLALVLFAAVAFLWHQVDTAYDNILQTSTQVNELATRLQESLSTMDNDELAAMLQDLPEIAANLSDVDVNTLNEALARIPELTDAVTDLQQRVEGIQNLFSGLNPGGWF